MKTCANCFKLYNQSLQHLWYFEFLLLCYLKTVTLIIIVPTVTEEVDINGDEDISTLKVDKLESLQMGENIW